MESIQGIYCIKNTINDEFYIGSSYHIYKRRNRHFSELKNNKHKNYKLQMLYNLYGKESFIFSIIEVVKVKENLVEREQYYINFLKPEININLIANSSLGVKRSDETKEKIRQANLGLKHPEWRNRIKSEAQGGDNHWTKKKKFSHESKNKMSESQKKLYENGYTSPSCRKIDQFTLDNDFIKTWESATEAQRYLNISRFAIAQCLIGKNKTSGGFIWKYTPDK